MFAFSFNGNIIIYKQYFFDDISNFRTIIHPQNDNPVYVRDLLSFTTIQLPGNTSLSDDNQNIFLNARYDVTITYYDRTSEFVFYRNPSNPAIIGVTPNIGEGTIDLGAAIVNLAPKTKALFQSKSFTQDTRNYEAYSTYSWNKLGGNDSRSFSFNGAANISGNNTYYIRTETNGGSSGLIHEGIGKYFYYGSNEYWREDDKLLASLKIEGPTSSIWGEFNDGNEDYGFGRYSS